MAGVEIDETLTADPSAATAPSSGEERIAPGSLALGRYEVVRFVAAGAMGEVYEARDRVLGETVAVKVLKPALAGSPSAVERLVRELALARKVTHPGICRLHDVHQHDDRAFLSMELLAGESLADRLRRGPLPAPELDDLARQLVAALATLHAAGVVHRDLKSGNIMLVPGDAGVRAVVTDFGLARSLVPAGDARLTGDGTMLGTPAYMAPEQVEGREATPASDIYSLGVVLFEMATGALPFHEETALATATARLTRDPPRPRALRPDLAPRWEQAILRCLARDPGARPRRVEDVLAPTRRRAWRPIVAGVATLAIATGAWELAARGGAPDRAGQASRTGGPGAAPAVCVPAEARLRDVWDGAIRARIGARFDAHPDEFVHDAWRGHARQFDRLAAAWGERWDAACASGDRTADPLRYGQRLACLEHNLVELHSYVNGVADTSVDVETFVLGSPGEFPVAPASDCDIAAYLRAQVPPPPAASRAEIDALMAELHQVRARLRFAGNAIRGGGSADPALALARLDELRTRLLALDYPAGAGEVGYWYGVFLGWFERADESRRVLQEVADLAERTRDDVLLVKALTAQVLQRADNDRGYDVGEGDALLRRAVEVAARVGDPRFLRDAIAEARLMHVGRRGDAPAHIAALGELAARNVELGLPSFALWRRTDRAALIAAHGDAASAVVEATRVLADREALVGPTNLHLGQDLIALAPIFARAGDHARALAMAERAAAIVEQPTLSRPWSWSWDAHRIAAAAAFGLGRRDVAEHHVERAVRAGLERHGSPLAAHVALADELRRHGERAAAEQVLALATRIAGTEEDRARVAEAAAALDAETLPIVSGQPRIAAGRLRAELDALNPALPWRAAERSELNARYGIALVESGAGQAAVSPLVEAIWIQELCCGGAAVIAQEARFALARALVEVEGERTRALGLADRARERLATMGPPLAHKTATIDAWLAQHRSP